jgi:prepilin-type N-terminal cleavage/methylation domain-containing protein
MTVGRRTKLNNKGLSLIEIVVVVLILAIITGGITIAWSTVYNAKVDNAAKRLQSTLRTAREVAMSHVSNTTYLEVKTESDNLYARVYTIGPGLADADREMVAEEKLGNTHITAVFKANKVDAVSFDSDETVSKTAGSDPIRIYYNAANGSCERFTEGSTEMYYTDVVLSGSETISLVIIPESGRAVKN